MFSEIDDVEDGRATSKLSHSFSSNRFLPPEKRMITGYSGHIRSGPLPKHVLRTPLDKYKILGYSGFSEGNILLVGLLIFLLIRCFYMKERNML